MLSVAQDIVNQLTPYQNALNTALDAMTSLPLVGEELSELQEWNTIFQDSVTSLSSQVDTLTNGHFELAIPLPSLSETFTFDLGLDAFLQVNTSGGVSAAINPVLKVGFDLTNGVPSLDPTSTGLDIGFVIGLPNFQLTASLNGLLYAQAVDAGTTFSGNLGFNFDTNFGIETNFSGDAHVRLGLSLSLVDPALNASFNPRFFTDLELDWGFDTQGDQLKVPVIAFRNFSLDADSFMQGFLGDTVKSVQKFTKPMQPFIDIFEQPVPIVSSFDSSETLGDLFLKGAGLSEEQQDRFNTMVKIVKAVNTFDFSGTTGGAVVNFGDIVLTGDARQTGQFFFDTTQLQGVIDDIMNSPALQEVQEKLETVAEYVGFTADAGFKYPLLENPGPVIGSLLTGQAEVMFSYSTGRQHFELGASLGVGIPDLLGFFINAGIVFDANLSVGYDTAGFIKFVQDQQPASLLHGFYIDNSIDTSGPPIPNVPNPRKTALYLQGYASLSASAVVTISGGLYADIAFELASSSNSNHVYLDDIISNLSSNTKVFNPSGRFYAAANIELTVPNPVGPNITLFSHRLSYHEIVSFNLPPAPTPSLPLTVIDVTNQHTLLLDVTKMTAQGKVKVQPFHNFTLTTNTTFSGDGIRVDYPNEIVMYVERKNDITTNYYNFVGLSGDVPNGVSIDIIDPFTVFATEGAPDPQPPQTESGVLLAGGQSVVYRYSENAGGSLATVLLVGGLGSNSLTGGTMSFGNFIPAARINEAKNHFGNITGFDSAGQAYVSARIDSVLAPASPNGIIGSTITSNRGGLMYGGPGNNSFYATGPGAYDMIGGAWTNNFTISPSFNGVPATYQIDGGPFGQSTLTVRVPANENVTFENSTLDDKYNAQFKALAVTANAGLSATAHGIKKVQVVTQPGAGVTIGDTSLLNIEFAIVGAAELAFGGTNAPDVFNVSTSGFYYALEDEFPVPYYSIYQGTATVNPSTIGRAPTHPVYTVTRTFGTNGRTQTIPFAVSNAAASSLKLNAGGASDTYNLTLGLGAYIDVTVADSDANTRNSLTVNVRDSVLRNNRVVLTDNELQLDYYTATILRDVIPVGPAHNISYLYGWWTSAHYTPTVHFGANNDFKFATALPFLQTTINRPLGPQAAQIVVDGQWTTSVIPFQSFGPQATVFDATTNPLTSIDFQTAPIKLDVLANGGPLTVERNFVSGTNPRTITVIANTGSLTFTGLPTWNGAVETYDIAGNSGTVNVNAAVAHTGIIALAHVVNVRGNSGVINLDNGGQPTIGFTGINMQVNVGANGNLAPVQGTLKLTRSNSNSIGLKLDNSAGSGAVWSIGSSGTQVSNLNINHAAGMGLFSKYEALTGSNSQVTLFSDPFFITRKLNGVDFPTWFLFNPGNQFNRVTDVVSLPASISGNPGGVAYTATNLPPGLSINPTTGLISGTITDLAFVNSPYATIVRATSGGLTRGQAFEWRIGSGIQILFDVPSDLLGRESAPLTLPAINTTNLYNNPVTLSVAGLPSGLSLNPNTRRINGVIAIGAAQNSPYRVTVSATDGIQSEAISFDLPVTGITLTTPPIAANHHGDPVNRQISATTASGAPVIFSAEGLPPGLSINPNTGVITGTPTNTTTNLVKYQALIRATQGADTVANTFTWTIVPAGATNTISFYNLPHRSHQEGSSASANGGTQQTLNFMPNLITAQGLPPGLTLTYYSDFEYFDITGTVPLGAATGSPYHVVLTVTDGLTSTQAAFNWTITQLPLGGPGDFNGDNSVTVADFDFWKAHFGATSYPGIRADANGNGVVDAADYTVWRDKLGQPASSNGSGAGGNSDDHISPEDYNGWRTHFGQTGGSGGAEAALPSIESAPALNAGVALQSSFVDSTMPIMISGEPIMSEVRSTPFFARPSVVDRSLFETASGIGSRPGRHTLVMGAIEHPSDVGSDRVSSALALLLANSLGRRIATEDLTPTFHTQASDNSEDSEDMFCSAVDNAFEDFGSQMCQCGILST